MKKKGSDKISAMLLALELEGKKRKKEVLINTKKVSRP
jgi:hypothetical protein